MPHVSHRVIHAVSSVFRHFFPAFSATCSSNLFHLRGDCIYYIYISRPAAGIYIFCFAVHVLKSGFCFVLFCFVILRYNILVFILPTVSDEGRSFAFATAEINGHNIARIDDNTD